MCQAHFELDVSRGMFADCLSLLDAVRPYIADGPCRPNLTRIFPDVFMTSRSMAITRVRRRSFAELLAHCGAALAMPNVLHPESMERDRSIIVIVFQLLTYDQITADLF